MHQEENPLVTLADFLIGFGQLYCKEQTEPPFDIFDDVISYIEDPPKEKNNEDQNSEPLSLILNSHFNGQAGHKLRSLQAKLIGYFDSEGDITKADTTKMVSNLQSLRAILLEKLAQDYRLYQQTHPRNPVKSIDKFARWYLPHCRYALQAMLIKPGTSKLDVEKIEALINRIFAIRPFNHQLSLLTADNDWQRNCLEAKYFFLYDERLSTVLDNKNEDGFTRVLAN